MPKSTTHYTPTDHMTAAEKCIKRLADVCISSCILVVLSPLFLLIAFMMKRQSNGKIIFRQERIGYKGRPFTIYKFRTLSSEIEENGPQLIPNGENCGSTRFEQYLRRTHLDELPQLWNVLLGDMSLVGPRPERKHFIDKIMAEDPRYEYIYLMRPGLTSRATIENGYTDTMEKMLRRLEMDLEYLQKRTLLTDISLLWYTFKCLIKGI